LTVSFTIQGKLANLNDYTCANRRNKYAGAQMKGQAEHVIIGAIQSQIHNVHFTMPVMMCYTWIEKDKRRDKDNIAFARKFIQDALVKTGVLKNDGWDYIEGFTDRFSVDKKNPRIIVEITDGLPDKALERMGLK